MMAAVYARKSTEQNAVVDEAKSVARQVEHARAFAEERGWTIADEHVYVDDAISGAEFQNRPGYMRLLNSLKPRAPFQVLIVSELSRLGREQLETGYACKQLSQAGVRIYSYLEDREIALDSATDVFLLSAVAFAAEIEREKARQRVTDAMSRKARAGHVCGGEPFGYRNREVSGPDGRRSHVEREVCQPEAAIVRRIFELCAAGKGVKGIAKLLNQEGVPSPRPKLNRPRAWSPSSVRAVLHNEVYKGVHVWNKRKRSDRWGQRARTSRPESQWIRVPIPHWRVVTDEEWDAAHRRLQAAAAVYLRRTGGKSWGKPPSGVESKYLLAGLGACALCRASMTVRASSHSRGHQLYFICANYDHRGSTVCANGMRLPMARADEAILDKVSGYVLDPEIVEGAIADAIEELRPSRDSLDQKRLALQSELRRVEGEQDRLVTAIATAGDVEALARALQDRERQRIQLRQQLAALERFEPFGAFDMRRVERDLRKRLDEWHALLHRQTPLARQVLSCLLDGRIAWTPRKPEGLYEFSGRVKLDQLLSGIVDTQGMVPVRGFEPRFDG